MRDTLFSAPEAKSHTNPQFKKWMPFDLKTIGLDEIPYLAANEVGQSVEGIPPHRHPGMLEISYLVRGEQFWNIDGRDYHVRGNEVLVKFPGELHGSGKHPYGKGRNYTVRLRFPEKGKSFLTLDSHEAKPLISALRKLPRRSFPAHARLQSIYDEIVLLLISHEKSPLKKLRVARLLQEWLCIVIDCAHAAQSPTITPEIKKVVRLIHDKPDANPTMPEMAREAGLSVPWFKAKFKRQLGVAPMEYLMRTKVEEAKKMLRNSKLSVTEVAYELGFSNSQYFATVFKRFTNKKPSEWRT